MKQFTRPENTRLVSELSDVELVRLYKNNSYIRECTRDDIRCYTTQAISDILDMFEGSCSITNELDCYFYDSNPENNFLSIEVIEPDDFLRDIADNDTLLAINGVLNDNTIENCNAIINLMDCNFLTDTQQGKLFRNTCVYINSIANRIESWVFDSLTWEFMDEFTAFKDHRVFNDYLVDDNFNLWRSYTTWERV